MDKPVSAIMTPRERLVTVKEGASRDEVQRCCTSTASRRCWWSTTPSSCAG
jgi:CBS domain containing-hemolysin-like protein